MRIFRKFLLPLLGSGLIFATLSASATPVVFNFDSDTPGTANSFDLVDGLALSFTGAGTVCDVSGDGFTSLSGNALITDDCGGTFGATAMFFSSPLSSLTFDYAISGEDPVGVLYLLDGDSPSVGSLTPDTSDGSFFEGSRTVTGLFNEVLFDTGSSNSDYALDNFSAVVAPVPEPSSIIMLGSGLLGFAGLVRRRFKA